MSSTTSSSGCEAAASPHEGDRGVRDRHALDDRGVVEAEGNRERLAAAWPESAGGLAQREDKLIETRERDVRLELDA